MRYLSHFEKEKRIAMYSSGMSTLQVAKKCGVTSSAIYFLLKRAGTSLRSRSEAQRTYEVNEKAFDTLTSQSAYWLGFVYADGYIYDKTHLLQVGLQMRDRILLEELRKFLKSSHPIKTFHYNGVSSVRLSVYSKYLFKKLLSLGLHQRKSLDLKFPEFLSDFLCSDFIRGYFDGDGSVVRSKAVPSSVFWNITSTESFALKVQKLLMKECQLKKTKLYHYPWTSQVSLSYGGTKQVWRIVKYLTRHKGFYLSRKLGKIIDKEVERSEDINLLRPSYG